MHAARGTLATVGLLLFLLPAAGSTQSTPAVPLARPSIELTAGEGRPEWSRIEQMLVRDSLLYVSQPEEHAILVLDQRGRQVRRIGRPGEGPGEFKSIATMGFKGDTLWVHDGVLRRITFFSATGSVHRVTVLPPLDVRRFTRPGVLGVSDRAEVALLFVPRMIGDSTSNNMYLRVLRADESLHELATLRAPRGAALVPPRGGLFISPQYQKYFSEGTPFFVRGNTISVFEVSPTGLVTQQEYRYDGTRGRRRRFTVPLVPVPPRFASVIEDSILLGLKRRMSDADARSVARREFPIPDTFPRLLRATPLPNDDLLIGLPNPDPALVTWSVLDARNIVRPVFAMSRDFLVLAVHGTRLWGTRRDNDGLDVIVAYDVPRR